MCKGKYLIWISSRSKSVSQYTASPNSVKDYQLQFRGLPKAEKYLLNVEALSIQGVAAPDQNPQWEPKAYFPPPIPLTAPVTPALVNSGLALMSITGFNSQFNFQQLESISSAQTKQTNIVASFNTKNMEKQDQSTTQDDIHSVPLVIDPPNDGNYTISFTGVDERRILIGANNAAANPALQPLGDYMLCLSLQPMSAKEIANFYPLERACH